MHGKKYDQACSYKSINNSIPSGANGMNVILLCISGSRKSVGWKNDIANWIFLCVSCKVDQ